MLATRRGDRIHRPLITLARIRELMGSFPGVVEYWLPEDLALDTQAAVASWVGGKGAHTWSQSTGSAKPALVKQGLRGRDVLSFGGDDYMTKGGATLADNFDGDDQPCFCLAVITTNVLAGVRDALLPTVRTSAVTGYHAGIGGSSASVGLRRRGVGEGTTTVFPQAASLEAPVVLATRHTGTAVDVWANRTKVSTGSALDTATMSTGEDSALGANINGGTASAFWNGLIAAHLLATTGMTSTDVSELIRALMLYYRLGS